MRKIRGNVVGTTMSPKKIAERIGTTGGGMPEVTEEDNGKFMQAVNGAWVAVDAVPQVAAIVENYVNSMFVPVTQEEYDALGSVDPNKYYMIKG